MTLAQDLETRKCELAEWEAALAAARSGASYTIDGVSVTRQDVPTVLLPRCRQLRRAVRELEAATLGARAPSVRVARLT